MSLDFDSFFSSAESLDANDIVVACSPVGTPGGVVVMVYSYGTSADQVVSATYGGVAMAEVSVSPLIKTSTELMVTHAFALGSGIPTGAQNLVVDRSGANSMKVDVVIFTAAANVEVVDSDVVQSDSAANPSTPTLSFGGRSCAVILGFVSGQSAPTGVTPRTNWTSRAEFDHGAGTSGTYTYDIVGSSDVTPGWNQAADDANGIAVAISEVVGGGGQPTPRRWGGTPGMNLTQPTIGRSW